MRNQIEQNVMAYHGHLSKEWISKQSTQTLLAWCHPIDRKDFKYELSKL